MDATQAVFSVAIAVLGTIGWGVAGFTLGRVQRFRRHQQESRANLARSLQRAESRSRAVRFGSGLSRDPYTNSDTNGYSHVNGVSDSDSDSNGDDDGDDLHGADDRSSGRRAIPRPDYRPRAGRYAAGRNTRSADETALVLAGYDR